MYNRITHPALKTETPYMMLYGKYADISHLKIIGVRAFVRMKDPDKLGYTSWEQMECGFRQNESNSFRIWNPKTCRIVGSRNAVFIKISPHLLPPFRQYSPLLGLEAPTVDFYGNSLAFATTLHAMTGLDAIDYASPLNFEANDRLLFPTPGGYPPGGATLQQSPSFYIMNLRLRQKRRLHPCLHRRHRKQPPRAPTATPCSPRRYPRRCSQSSSFVCIYGLSGQSKQPRNFGSYHFRRKRLNRCASYDLQTYYLTPIYKLLTNSTVGSAQRQPMPPPIRKKDFRRGSKIENPQRLQGRY